MQQTKGKIFLASERGVNEADGFRSWNTFNFGLFYNEHKKSFGNIYVLNDDTLAGGHSLKMLAEENSYTILLPIAGAIDYNDNLGNKSLIAAGQSQLFLLEQGDSMQITNPFKDQLVNFLQVWIKAGNDTEFISPNFLTYADVNENLNQLVKVFWSDQLPVSVSIGKFSGRGETTYSVHHKNTGVFVFILEGAFEVEGRLLHPRDGLALWETAAVEMEALSDEAIMLVIECPLNF